MNYIILTIWFIAAISQLMSIFDIRRDVNVLIWLYLVFYSLPVVDFIISIFYFLAYDTAYTGVEAGSTSSTYAASVIVKETVWKEI